MSSAHLLTHSRMPQKFNCQIKDMKSFKGEEEGFSEFVESKIIGKTKSSSGCKCRCSNGNGCSCSSGNGSSFSNGSSLTKCLYQTLDCVKMLKVACGLETIESLTLKEIHELIEYKTQDLNASRVKRQRLYSR